jgi:hypothetical protein
MADNRQTRVRLEHRDRLTFRRDAERAGVAADDVRPLHRHWAEHGTVGRVRVDECWFESELDGGWAAAFRIVAQPGGLAVGELRLFPADDLWRQGRTPPGEWGGVLRGTRAQVPQGGLSARLLRRVRFDQREWYPLLNRLTTQHGRLSDRAHPGHGRAYVPYVLARAGVRAHPRPVPKQKGRPRLPERDYERIAREYKRLLARRRSGRLYEELAAILGLTVTQARNRVARARQYGYLRGAPSPPRRQR